MAEMRIGQVIFSVILLVIVIESRCLGQSQSQNQSDFQVENSSNDDKNQGGNNETLEDLFDAVAKLFTKYDKSLRPNVFGGPTNIAVNLLVKNIASVKEADMEYKLEVYLRQTWRDARLAYGHHVKTSMEYLLLEPGFLDKIWTPDTYFNNEKEIYEHKSPKPNIFIRLYRNGTCRVSMRLTITASCNFNLKHFPMDNQICGLEFGSYSYTPDHINYELHKNSVVIDLSSLTLAPLQVKRYKITTRIQQVFGEDYKLFSVQFLFVRNINFYLAQVYTPSILVVVVAYFALWMGRDSNEMLAARLGLGITSVLTMTTVYMEVNENAPAINYLKAMDYYLGICFLGVFATMFQSSFVIYLCKKASVMEKESKKRGRAIFSHLFSPARSKYTVSTLDVDGDFRRGSDKDGDGESTVKSRSSKTREKDKEESKWTWKKIGQMTPDPSVRGEKRIHVYISRLDVACRILFPLAFLSFNLVYWIYYLIEARVDFDGDGWSEPPQVEYRK